MIYSEGLLDLLSQEEAQAVIGHELGHAKSWDILVASIASAVPTLIRELGARVSALAIRHDDEDRDDASRSSGAILWAIRALAFAAELTELSLSRTRELHADRFGAKACGSAAAMARALIKVSYGLAARRPNQGRRISAALAVQAPEAAQATLLASGASGSDEDFAVHAMAWDLWNPWARVYELQSTHPTTARRIQALAPVSRLQGEAPAVHFDLERTQSLWPAFVVDVFFAVAPTVALVVAGWAVDTRGLDTLGWGLIAVGLALGCKAWFKYRGRRFPEVTVADLMTRLEASPVRGVPCTLTGHIIGRGEPGLVWSHDLTFRDGTGLILVDHRQPLAIWEFLWGLMGAQTTIGGDAVLEGWFRRGPMPYIELKRSWIDGKVRRSYFRWLIYSLVLVCVVAGILVVLELYEPAIAWLEKTF